jgi:hypothetical protein
VTPGQSWAAIALALLIVFICAKSDRIETGVGVLLALVFLLSAVYLISGGQA